MKYGFVKTAVAVPTINVGDCHYNANSIITLIDDAAERGIEILLLPELCLTSCNCGDLFCQPYFIAECNKAADTIARSTVHHDTIVVFGAPVMHNNSLYNCAIAVHKGEIVGIVAKNRLTSQETRWFTSGKNLPRESKVNICGRTAPIESTTLFKTDTFSFGIEIGNESASPIPTGALLAVSGADIILNPASWCEEVGLISWLKSAITQQSSRYKSGYMFTNSGWGESTSNAVYSGYSAIAECGMIIAEAGRFNTVSHLTITEIDIEKVRKERLADKSFAQNKDIPYIYIRQRASESTTLTRDIAPHPFIAKDDERYNDIFMIQATALARRMEHTHSKTAVIGVSGGLDSTLALLVTAKAFDIIGKPHCDIIAVTMPGFGTTDRTYTNAINLMKALGTTIKEISIKDACIQHFKDINHDVNVHDTTFENSQARERTQILMDIANSLNGIVVGTGDLSELALGWATYNGDHMSMYGVNASVPKTLMQHIVRKIASGYKDETCRKTLLDIVDTPISPELVPADENGNIKQKTEDLVGPYELHDFFLYNFVRNGNSPEKIFFLAQKAFDGKYSDSVIKKWLTTFIWRFFTQQFKRSCMPDGPRTGSCNLGAPGWTMPSDTSPGMFSELCKNIKTEQ